MTSIPSKRCIIDCKFLLNIHNFYTLVAIFLVGFDLDIDHMAITDFPAFNTPLKTSTTNHNNFSTSQLPQTFNHV